MELWKKLLLIGVILSVGAIIAIVVWKVKDDDKRVETIKKHDKVYVKRAVQAKTSEKFFEKSVCPEALPDYKKAIEKMDDLDIRKLNAWTSYKDKMNNAKSPAEGMKVQQEFEEKMLEIGFNSAAIDEFLAPFKEFDKKCKK